MNVLDENVAESERHQLESWRIHVRQISHELGHTGMTDQDVLPLLHYMKSVTFFTHDVDYYQRRLCHAKYCLVYLDIVANLAAETIRRFLRHPAFRTWALRKGKVIRVTPNGMHVWRLHARELGEVPW